jgi:hypothetical protein
MRDRLKIDGKWFVIQNDLTWIEGDFWHMNAVRVLDDLTEK